MAGGTGTHGTVACRGWCWTLNNWTDHEVEHIAGIECSYLIWGYEVGAQGTEHLQGYIHFGQRGRRFNGVKRLFPERTHLEPSRGGVDAAIEYCKKDGNFVEKGLRPSAVEGRKRGAEATAEKWAETRKRAKAGEFDAIDDQIFICHRSSLMAIRSEYMQGEAAPMNLDTVCGVWIYGPPGSGKSYFARSCFPRAFIKNCNKWWDGYRPDFHRGVIMDDVDADLCRALGHHIKIWADKYPFVGEVKNSSLFIRPINIIVTSNYSMEECFGHDHELLAAMRRRFRRIHIAERGSIVNEDADEGVDPKIPMIRPAGGEGVAGVDHLAMRPEDVDPEGPIP